MTRLLLEFVRHMVMRLRGRPLSVVDLERRMSRATSEANEAIAAHRAVLELLRSADWITRREE